MASRPPYKEGDWFAVPLPSGGFGVGLVARAHAKGKVLFGYFFGSRRQELPRAEELGDLKPDCAIAALRFGDLGLIRQEWRVVGRDPAWNRERWPMPRFLNDDPLTGDLWQVEYSEDDPGVFLGEQPIPEEAGRLLPEDGMHGAGSVERLLDNLLT